MNPDFVRSSTKFIPCEIQSQPTDLHRMCVTFLHFSPDPCSPDCEAIWLTPFDDVTEECLEDDVLDDLEVLIDEEFEEIDLDDDDDDDDRCVVIMGIYKKYLKYSDRSRNALTLTFRVSPSKEPHPLNY